MEMEMEMEMEIKHLSHQHPLTLCEKVQDDGDYCYGCKQLISGPTYGCRQCKNFFLHKSCAELPQQIQHPFHPLHPLTLLHKSPYYSTRYVCNACRKTCSGFVFHCATCQFDLDVGCSSLVPTISYEGHDHLLTLFDKIYEHPSCNACDRPCDALVFRCVMCDDFNLHIHCFPSLPRTIKHKCHINPLFLTNSVVKDDGSGKFYCDACEKERNPKDPVYYCAECQFAAHISCVISKDLDPSTFKESNLQSKKQLDLDQEKDYIVPLLPESTIHSPPSINKAIEVAQTNKPTKSPVAAPSSTPAATVKFITTPVDELDSLFADVEEVVISAVATSNFQNVSSVIGHTSGEAKHQNAEEIEQAKNTLKKCLALDFSEFQDPDVKNKFIHALSILSSTNSGLNPKQLDAIQQFWNKFHFLTLSFDQSKKELAECSQFFRKKVKSYEELKKFFDSNIAMKTQIQNLREEEEQLTKRLAEVNATRAKLIEDRKKLGEQTKVTMADWKQLDNETSGMIMRKKLAEDDIGQITSLWSSFKISFSG